MIPPDHPTSKLCAWSEMNFGKLSISMPMSSDNLPKIETQRIESSAKNSPNSGRPSNDGQSQEDVMPSPGQSNDERDNQSEDHNGSIVDDIRKKLDDMLHLAREDINTSSEIRKEIRDISYRLKYGRPLVLGRSKDEQPRSRNPKRK